MKYVVTAPMAIMVGLDSKEPGQVFDDKEADKSQIKSLLDTGQIEKYTGDDKNDGEGKDEESK